MEVLRSHRPFVYSCLSPTGHNRRACLVIVRVGWLVGAAVGAAVEGVVGLILGGLVPSPAVGPEVGLMAGLVVSAAIATRSTPDPKF